MGANPAADQAWATLHEWATQSAAAGLVEYEPGTRPHELVVSAQGQRRKNLVTSWLVTSRALSVVSFICRRPDENHEDVFRFLLRRNLKLPGLSFAIDDNQDIFLRGHWPLTAVSTDTCDSLMGALVLTADYAFDEILVRGFSSAIRREWAWRIDRGESTENLAAFRTRLDLDASINPPAQ